MSASFLFLDRDDDFFENRAQQLLLVAGRSGGRVPGDAQIGAEREQTDAFIWTERPRLLLLAARQFGLGGFEVPQGFLPLGLEASGDKPIIGVHGHVATLGSALFVSRALDRVTPVRESAVTIGFQPFGGRERGFDAERRQRGEKRAADGFVDLHGADVEAIASTTFDDVLARAVIAGRCGSAGIVRAQFAPAIAANGETLQKRAAFSHRAASHRMRPGTRISGNAFAIGFIGGPIDVAFMMVSNEHRPFGKRQFSNALLCEAQTRRA